MARREEMKMILALMEDFPTGSTSILTGGSMAQDEEQIQDEMLIQGHYAGQNENSPMSQNGTNFTALELRLATRFAELVGGAERAKELLEKVQDCQQCLGVDEQLAQLDSDRIYAMADMIPQNVDLPTARAAGRPTTASEFSSLYNPSADMRPSL